MSEKEKPEISVIVPIVERYDNLRKLYSEFSEAFDKLGKPYEFIFIVDGGFSEVTGELQDLQVNNSLIRIIELTRKHGESVAISIGVEKAMGPYIFTLASYFQVEPACVNTIWNELNNGYDLVISRRYPRIDSIFNIIQSFVFHGIINKISSTHFHDISCGVKGMKATIFNEINLYADLHRFIPILADKYGFKIKEIKAKQRKEDTSKRLLKSGAYIRRVLDIFTIFFITKFTMKPLRFFGLIGIALGGVGGGIMGYLGAYRLLGLGGIADRPLLLLGVLLMVLGIQTISIGLIGEIIIFTHARGVKEYNVEEYLTDD